LGFFNSGLVDPVDSKGVPSTITWKIGAMKAGELNYLCGLHYASGMVGKIAVA